MSNVEKIQQFLSGKLSSQETLALQKRMQEDPTFKKEVEDYQSIFLGLKYIKQAKFEAKVKEWNKKLPPLDAPAKKTFSLFPFLKKAVAALVILGLFALLYQSFQSQTTLEEFGQKNYVALALDTNRGQSMASANNYAMAELNFDQKKYNACIIQLNTIEATDTFYLKALHLKQHALYQSQKHQEVLQVFSKIQSIENPKNYLEFGKDNAAWTAILSQVALYQNSANPEDKIQLLQSLNNFLQKNTEETYQARAMELKSLLD